MMYKIPLSCDYMKTFENLEILTILLEEHEVFGRMLT